METAVLVFTRSLAWGAIVCALTWYMGVNAFGAIFAFLSR